MPRELAVTFWTYILKCADGSYYTGHTDDLEFRLAQHDQGAIPTCHTFSRRPVELVYSQAFDEREDAFRAERQIKGWRREKKEALITGRFDLLPSLARAARRGVLRQAQDERVLRQAQDERVSQPDARWMRHALDLALRGQHEDDEIPVGAVVVSAEGELLGEGWN